LFVVLRVETTKAGQKNATILKNFNLKVISKFLWKFLPKSTNLQV